MSGFRVGITNDFAPGGTIGGWIDAPLAELLAPLPGLEWEFLPESLPLMAPELVRDFDAVVTGDSAWTAASVRDQERLTLIAYWGIGVDKIDLLAATESDVVVANSPSAANHASVAESALMLMLALSKQLLIKDRLTREGRAVDAQQLTGSLIQGHVVGTIGLGATARRLVEFLRPLQPARLLAHDPYVSPSDAARLGVELVDLETVMRESDYVCVMCTLTEETRGLLDEELLGLMKPEAYLLNTARGPIVDQRALVRALEERRIAGAGLDVLDPEPPPVDDPILALDNVIATGHALAWTTESLAAACAEPCRAVARVYEGREPEHVANPGVLTRPGFRAKLGRRARSPRAPA